MISNAYAYHCAFGGDCTTWSSDPEMWLLLLAGVAVLALIVWIVETLRGED